jgi:hypothetical protein
MPDSTVTIEHLRVLEQSLEQLEARLSFNLFEAIGVQRQELRHSDFLGFLLSPTEKHGLQDLFVRKLLFEVGISHIGDLNDAKVEREKHTNYENQRGYIDLLIVSKSQKLAVVIENKVGSQEHSQQNFRYEQHLQQTYPDYQHVLIYLTTRGEQSETKSYHPFRYDQIVGILEAILADLKITRRLKTDVKVTIEHYIELLRRHVVPDSDIAKLSQGIYKEHYQAFEYVLQHIPLQQRLATYFESKFDAQSEKLHLKKHFRWWDERRMDFFPEEWMRFSGIVEGEPENYVLRFRYWSGDSFPEEEGVKLYLAVNPAPDLEPLRIEILRVARANPLVFKVKGGDDTKWKEIWQRQILTKQQLVEYPFSELMRSIDAFWDDFFEGDFERIKQIIRQINYPTV